MSTDPPITSLRNPKVVEAVKLHRKRERIARGSTLLEGPHLLRAAVESGARIESVFASVDDETTPELLRRSGIEVNGVSDVVLTKLAPTQHPRGPVAVMEIPSEAGLRTSDTVVLYEVADPGNVGTLIRTAAAFGFDVAIGPGTADPWSPKALRAGAGAHFLTSFVPVGPDPIDDLHRAGLTVVATVAHGGAAPERLGREALALLIGSEPSGLPERLSTAADLSVTIPTRGVESLNAATAGSILMYERCRQRDLRA